MKYPFIVGSEVPGAELGSEYYDLNSRNYNGIKGVTLLKSTRTPCKGSKSLNGLLTISMYS